MYRETPNSRRGGVWAMLAALLPLCAAAQPAPSLPSGIQALASGPNGIAVPGNAAPIVPPSAASALKRKPLANAKGIMSVVSNADGGWPGGGHMLILSQRGYNQSSPPMRPPASLPSGARVTSVYWRIKTSQPLPSTVSMTLCATGKCLALDGQAGRSDALAGMPAANPFTLVLSMAGQGALTPPVVVTDYQILVNYRDGAKR